MLQKLRQNLNIVTTAIKTLAPAQHLDMEEIEFLSFNTTSDIRLKNKTLELEIRKIQTELKRRLQIYYQITPGTYNKLEIIASLTLTEYPTFGCPNCSRIFYLENVNHEPEI